MPQLIPVFLYHRVEIDDDPFAIDPEVFASHLELIAASGRTSLTMSELGEALRGERSLPPDAVGLTFDDGYADTRATLESAAALGVKSTLYVTTGTIGCQGAITTADVMRLAGSEFVELGAHTVTHPYLDELWTSEAAEEIVASRSALSEITGDPVRSFAYPHGAYSARIRNLVLAAGYDSAAAVKNALSHSADDPLAIARYTVTDTTPLSQVEALLRGEGAPLAWREERARTRGYRAVRVARRQLNQVRRTRRSAADGAASATVSPAEGIVGIRPPVAVAQIDLSASDRPVHLSEPREGRPYTAVAVLVRDHAKPLAWTVVPAPPNGLISREQLPIELQRHRSSSEVAPGAPPTDICVVVTTCAEADSTVACIRSLLASERLPAEIIVVENRPIGSGVPRAVQQAFADPPMPIRVVPEARRGLSHARNAGLRAASADVVAFTDDDIIADPYWLGSISRAFEQDPGLSCVTGLILPLELETDAQVEFEHFSGLGKGLEARSFSIHMGPVRDIPLFPYAAGHFGSGANASFRRAALLELGGFDPLLGAGTRTQGGEDMDIFIRLLTSGEKLAYEPSAIVWHRHPDTDEQVQLRILSYGVGFGAVVCKLMVSREHRSAVLRLIPSAVAYWFDPRSRKNAHRPDNATTRADQLRETMGVGLGVLAYAGSRLLAIFTPKRGS
jgi:O-antigen biosynthesis protein